MDAIVCSASCERSEAEMRILPGIVIGFMVARACGLAQADEIIAPRSACTASDLAASVDFGVDGKPLYFNSWAVQEIVREARACRFRQITLTMFTDGADRTVTGARAAALKAMLIESHWPQDAIATDRQPLQLAPSGTDRDGAWTAKALIGFADPDPSFVPRMVKPGEICSFDSKTETSTCKPLPWTIRRASRMPPPPPPFDPPRVFFAANQSALEDHAREFVEEGLRIFHDENYRKIALSGQAAPDETNGSALRLARATAVRDALIHMGVDPSQIVVEEERAPDADGPVPSVDMAFFRYVAFDYED
jgi:hypothetical protein